MSCMELYNEDGTFNSNDFEHIEQFMTQQTIEANDRILELGARYGSCSIIANQIIRDKTAHVVVEPDKIVWDALEKNKQKYNCQFQIVKGFMTDKKMYLTGDSYAARATDDPSGEEVPCVSYDNFKHVQFNVLIADCEGGLGVFLEEYPSIYDQLTKLIMEEDGDCDYRKIKVNLMKRGFIKVFEHGDYNGLLHSVWIKVANHPINYAMKKI